MMRVIKQKMWNDERVIKQNMWKDESDKTEDVEC